MAWCIWLAWIKVVQNFGTLTHACVAALALQYSTVVVHFSTSEIVISRANCCVQFSTLLLWETCTYTTVQVVVQLYDKSRL